MTNRETPVKTGKDHPSAKVWHFVAPDGTEYQIRNLNHFVRENRRLFAPADTLWKARRSGSGGKYCNAVVGLSCVSQGKNPAWKGWTLPGNALKARINWDAVDWNRSTNQLSEELGVSTVKVSMARRHHAPATMRKRSKNFLPQDWADVDWSKKNRQIAEEMDCSISPVRAARARHFPRV